MLPITPLHEYRTVDKSEWPRGPWDDEPDKVQWRDAATGLPCLIVRGPLGALCGYAGVAPGHPWHGLDYDISGVDADVHGGLTFAGACSPSSDESKGICHRHEPGEPDHVWWFGFDCAHLYDFAPAPRALSSSLPDPGDTYRDLAYVVGQVTYLARQLAEAGNVRA